MKSSHRYLLLTVICLVISGVVALLWVARNFPSDPYAGAAVAKVVPIVLPIATLVCFAFLWFPAMLLYTGVRWLRSPASFREEWRGYMGYFCIGFVLLGIAGFPWVHGALVPPTPKIDPKEKAHWNALASGPTVKLADFRRLIDAYSGESKRGVANLTWRYDVLQLATHNEGATTEYLSYLADRLEDATPLMGVIAANPHAPADALRRCAHIAAFGKDLAANPAIPPDVVDYLVKWGDQNVLARIIANPATPRDVIVRLTKHSEPWVRDAAQKVLDEHPPSKDH